MLNLEQQIFKQIEISKNILIVFPADREGDSVASALALFLFLKKQGYEVTVVSQGLEDTKHLYSFLPAYSQISANLNNLRQFIVSVDISQAKVNQIKYLVENNTLNFIISPSEGWFKPEDVSAKAGEFKHDLIITVGASDLESLGKLYDQNVEFFYKTTIINIDHRASNESFGQINFIDLNAVSISEILFYLLKNYKPELISEEIATCLLAGIIQKTKNFKTQNLTPRTLLTTSQLLSIGANREDIVTHLYRSRDLSTLKLWGRVLNNLRAEKGEELIWSQLKLQDFKDTNSSTESLNDIIDELIMNVPSAKLVAIFCELEANETKIILYSLKNINALEILKDYSPQGSIKIASAIIKNDLNTSSTDLILELKNKLEKISA
ncbi:MAG: DHH family phosphoesterase [Candidatus Falkowbacteria bacterium]